MNRKLIVKIVGIILLIEALCLLAPLGISLVCRGPDAAAFALSAALCAAAGALLSLVKPEKKRLQARDGFTAVALCWIALSLFGALPYFFTGTGYVDALFETVSGLTTTGASVIAAPEALPRGLQFWRALTQWMGGMGVLVMVLALLPSIGEGSVNLMKAESPGPIATKLRPRTNETAKSLYLIYLLLTLAETTALRIAGLPWFDSVTNALTTISTGGFCIHSQSIAFYQSEAVNWIIVLFMFVSGVNFSLLFALQRRQFRAALRSEELRVYAGVVLAATALTALDLFLVSGATAYQAVSQGAFQVVTLISTTGYATADFTLWPRFAQHVLLLVMFTGGCAGSTAGGIKISRVVILCKSLRRELRRILHSREVRPLMLDGQRVEEGTISSVTAFFFAYLLILLLCSAVVSLDGVGFDTSFSAALTMISNVGPGLAEVGPAQNFAFLSVCSKLTLSVTMLLGRLEIMPLLVLLSPSVWKK